MEAMNRNSFLLLRIPFVLACAITGLLTVLRELRPLQQVVSVSGIQILLAGRAPLWVIVSLETLGFIFFGWATWQVTRPEEILATNKRTLVLLGMQVLLAFLLTSSDLTYVLAVEIGLLFPLPEGAFYIVGQAAAECAMYLVFPRAPTGYHLDIHIPVYARMLIMSLFSVTYHLLSYSMGRLITQNYRQGKVLEAMQQVENESTRLAERLSISRELHDSIGHHLTALSVHLQLATRLVAGSGASSVDEAYQITRSLLNDVRSVVADLRGMDIAQLTAAMNAMAASIPTPKIQVDIDLGLSNIEPFTSHVLFRCAQEAITNAIRHSSAQNLWIKIQYSSSDYELEAHDDGKGVALLHPGNGLNGIRERVADLGGELSISTAPGKGFGVSVKIPRRSETL
jgi:signal transduction histidine kinase